MVQISPRVWFCPDTVLRRLLLLLGFFLSPQPVVTEWGIIKRGVMHSWWEVGIWMSYQPKEGGKHEPHARSKPSSNHIWHVWLGGLCSDNHILIPHVSLPVTAGGVFSAFYPHSLLWEAQNVQLCACVALLTWHKDAFVNVHSSQIRTAWPVTRATSATDNTSKCREEFAEIWIYILYFTLGRHGLVQLSLKIHWFKFF